MEADVEELGSGETGESTEVYVLRLTVEEAVGLELRGGTGSGNDEDSSGVRQTV